MEKKYKKIGVLTSGGDAPGMNAVIRAVVRMASTNGIEVIGINKGYSGLFNKDFKPLTAKSVCDIISRGGTILKTARCMEMMSLEGQIEAATVCKDLDIDTLVVIGGDGSLTGGLKLKEQGINIIGIPGTIDLDLKCSEYTIGFDTAVNTAVEAIDRLRDTSSSHERCSIVEVMGRRAGHIAVWSGVAGGADDVIIHEEGDVDIEELASKIRKNRLKGKEHNLIIVCEGMLDSQKLAEELEQRTGVVTRATILGHLQRGGRPTALDRVIASRMGRKAVELFMEDKKNVIVIYKSGNINFIDLEKGINFENKYRGRLTETVRILSL